MPNINPKYWGKCGWIFLSCVVYSYPENPSLIEIQNYKTFFTLIQNILPCDKCKFNYSNHLKILPITDKALKNRKAMIKWFISIRNMTNRELGKPIITYNDMENEIFHTFHKKKKKDNIYIYSMIIISFILMAFYYKKKIKDKK